MAEIPFAVRRDQRKLSVLRTELVQSVAYDAGLGAFASDAGWRADDGWSFRPETWQVPRTRNSRFTNVLIGMNLFCRRLLRRMRVIDREVPFRTRRSRRAG